MRHFFIFKVFIFSYVHTHTGSVHPDIKESQKVIKKLEKDLKLSDDKTLLERIEKVAKPLVEVVNKQKLDVSWGDKNINSFKYTFKIIDEKEINAFSLPGGFIYLYKGLLDYVESDDELAGVLAHEISHIAFRHGHHMGKEQQKTLLFAIPALLLGAFIGGDNGVALGQAGMFGSQLAVSNWSQKAEWAADYGAIQLLIKSKYNPIGILTFQERLTFDEQFKGNKDMGIYQTHPLSEERAKYTLLYLKKYNIPIKRSKVSKSMSTQIVPQPNHDIDLQYLGHSVHLFKGANALKRAQETQQNINLLFDFSPHLFSIKIVKDEIQTVEGKILIKINQSDAKELSTNIPDLIKETFQKLKRAIYQLNNRLGTNKG